MSKNIKNKTKNKAPSKNIKSKSSIKNKSTEKKDKKKEVKKPKKLFPLIPQLENYNTIYYNLNNNKTYLVDYKNHSFECNLYGEPYPSYKADITGSASYIERNDNELKKEYDKLFKLNNNNYIPETNKFEGYSKCPRPLVKPFSQIKDNNINKQIINAFNKENAFSDYFKILQKKENSDSSNIPVCAYMNDPISLGDKENKKYLINMIDNYIQEKKNEQKYNQNYVYKLSHIKELLQFRQKLLKNVEVGLNGKQHIKPNDDIIKDYNIIKAFTHKKNINSKLLDDYKKDTYNVLFKITGTLDKRTEPKIDETQSKTQNNFYFTRSTFTENDSISPRKTNTTWYKTTGFFNVNNKFKEDLTFCKHIY